MGHQVMTESMAGKSLVQSLDCKSCHKEAEASIGPAYNAVAKKYQKDRQAMPHLVSKVIKGGGGVWGETAMPAHPDVTESDARQMVTWILSLGNEAMKQKTLPAKGRIQPTLGKKPADNGALIISASYTDKGGNSIKPLTGT